MARPSAQIIMNPSDKHELELVLRSKKVESRIKERARIIMLWYEGKNYDETTTICNVHREAIALWRKRFNEFGFKGLEDAPRSGAPTKIKESQKNKVIKLACSNPKGGYSNWSQKRIGKETGMSQSKVHKILKEHDLKPHKVEYWCGKSTDPEFESKMLTIVGLYLKPPENAIVLCVDEKTQMQALDRTQPELPLRIGNPKRLTTTYKRNGVVNLIASLAVHQGQITAKTMESNNAENFLSFLKKLARKYPKKELHIIADNHSIHKHQNVKQWVEKNKRINLHHTPTYSSWLNQVEIWFNILSKDVLKGAVWHSKKQLTDQLMEYIKTYNKERAKPFQWTYQPD